jgi:nuclear pore complex protein Nup107
LRRSQRRRRRSSANIFPRSRFIASRFRLTLHILRYPRQRQNHRELIALYTAALGDTAVARYAKFLVDLGTALSLEERVDALKRARTHGLDAARVATATAAASTDAAFRALPPLALSSGAPLPVLREDEKEVEEEDALSLLMRSIEWTTQLEETIPTALEHANVVMRYLLASGRVRLAVNFFSNLPREVSVAPEPEAQAVEFADWKRFVGAWVALGEMKEWAGRGIKEGARKEEVLEWRKEYKGRVHEVVGAVMTILTGDWLLSESLGGFLPLVSTV